MATHYETLGVSPSATQKDIQDAYRYLAAKFHPDHNLGRETDAKVRFQRIQVAFEVLSHPEKRAAYDDALKQARTRSQQARAGPHGKGQNKDETASPYSARTANAATSRDVPFNVKRVFKGKLVLGGVVGILCIAAAVTIFSPRSPPGDKAQVEERQSAAQRSPLIERQKEVRALEVNEDKRKQDSAVATAKLEQLQSADNRMHDSVDERVGHMSTETPYAQNKNVVFGEVDGIGLMMDVFSPTGKSNGLGIVDVASQGYSSDRGTIDAHAGVKVFDIFCGKGYTVFAVRPGSISKFNLAAMASNVKQGVCWVKENADKYNIDPSRLGILGADSGGTLASLVAITSEDKTAVKAACVYCPLTDFLDFFGMQTIDGSTADGPRLQLAKQLAFPARAVPASGSELVEKLKQISPALLVTSKAPPFLIIHAFGYPVPLQQSEKLAGALQSAGVPGELIIKKGGEYSTIHEEVAIMAEWFDKQLTK